MNTNLRRFYKRLNIRRMNLNEQAIFEKIDDGLGVG